MKADFFDYQAQTSPFPLGMEVSHASGSYIYDTSGKQYLDFVAGVSACTLGHVNQRINDAITGQLQKYSHVMVYGEYAQHPATEYCKMLANLLPEPLNKVYLVNSGTEATEGALKLARRVTGRSHLISCRNAYHGNTMGSMSVMGYEERKQVFRPLVPDVDFITFNDEQDLKKITTRKAGVNPVSDARENSSVSKTTTSFPTYL
jgi:acetylornithine/N-succinyldiaminopimelate aminotransferase